MYIALFLTRDFVLFILFYIIRYCQNHPNFLLPATKMQTALKKKIINEKWWTKRAFEQRQELCDYEFETVKSIASRLKKDKYDREIEVDNYSDTSSQAEERKRDEAKQRKYDAYKGIMAPTAAEVQITVAKTDTGLDSDEEEEKARKRSKKNKKSDVPVAMTSTKRRASLASVSSTGSISESDRGGGSLKRQRSMGSRQGSLKSQRGL